MGQPKLEEFYLLDESEDKIQVTTTDGK